MGLGLWTWGLGSVVDAFLIWEKERKGIAFTLHRTKPYQVPICQEAWCGLMA